METSDQSIGGTLRSARLALGLSQRAVAGAAGVTQAHISRIERDDLNVQLPVLRRVARALGLRPVLEPAIIEPIVIDPYGDDEIANRQYLLGRLAARRLTADRIDLLRSWFERARLRLGSYSYFRRWLEICDQGPDAIRAVLTDPTEYGRYMRSVGTMRPFVSQEERNAFYRPDVSPITTPE